jgi:hypothetical protein
MKKLLIPIVCLVGCVSVRMPLATDAALIRSHPQPVTIFKIGRWNDDYSVLTLIDANNRYFTVTVKRNDSLKVGSVYSE